MPHNERNEHHCVACGICEMNCPNDTIRVESEMVTTEDGKKKKVLVRYLYDHPRKRSNIFRVARFSGYFSVVLGVKNSRRVMLIPFSNEPKPLKNELKYSCVLLINLAKNVI